jgi:hypothetical protein
MRQQFHPGHCFHPDIQNGKRYGVRRDVVEKTLSLPKGAHAESIRFEHSSDGFSHRWIVINEADDRVVNFGLVLFGFPRGDLAHIVNESRWAELIAPSPHGSCELPQTIPELDRILRLHPGTGTTSRATVAQRVH